jgi:hypothetical protein
VTEFCPLCGNRGKQCRTKTGAQLLKLYETYLGKSFPQEAFGLPMEATISEYVCPEDTLVWYTPAWMGDGDFYKTLATLHPWYYQSDTWDKLECVQHVRTLGPDWVVEVGAGDGGTLRALQPFVPQVLGIEINPDAVNTAQQYGIALHAPTELPPRPNGLGILYLLQTIEHLSDPTADLKNYTQHFNPEYLLISAPCSEALLGLTSDPLSWPPHHASAWNAESIRQLGLQLNYQLISTMYSPLTFETYLQMASREINAQIPGCFPFPRNRLGKLLFKLGQGFGSKRLKYGHSIFCLLQRI